VVSKARLERIAERIREELSDILLMQSQDPRLSGISITDVQVDRELDYATIYYSAVEGSERAKEILEGLRHAQGFLRSELTRRINLRSFPRLRFEWDPTYERAEHMEKLFAQLKQEEAQRGDSPEQPMEEDNDPRLNGEEIEPDGEE
jgi:ribosome-binding factor A